MKEDGFEIEWHSWVVDYAKTIKKAHIQLFPIVVGTGTKGKVLSGFATGLLCVGTHHAFENIDIDQNDDCLIITNDSDLISLLEQISCDRIRYARMAKQAMYKVRSRHSPVLSSRVFWEYIFIHFKWSNIAVC